MPKRRREEEGDENCGQALLKTHVSQKEVNLGVLQERNMQAVYNKTRELLFRGVKSLANNNAVRWEEGASDGAGRQSQDIARYRQLALTGGSAPALSGCCSCLRLDCSPTHQPNQCRGCGGRPGRLCAMQCESCGAAGCGPATSCRAVRHCGGCGTLYCGDCAPPAGPETCVCSLCTI